MNNNSLLQNVVFSLFIVVFACGCSTTDRTAAKQDPPEKEPVFEQSTSSPFLFTVLHVEVTKEAQHFVERFDMERFRPVIVEYEPDEGYSFVIVSYGLKNSSAIRESLKRSEFALIDRSGSSSNMGFGTSYDSSPSKPIWGSYYGRTLSPHLQEENKELFIVADDVIQGSKIIFYGKQYPLQLPPLSK